MMQPVSGCHGDIEVMGPFPSPRNFFSRKFKAMKSVNSIKSAKPVKWVYFCVLHLISRQLIIPTAVQRWSLQNAEGYSVFYGCVSSHLPVNSLKVGWKRLTLCWLIIDFRMESSRQKKNKVQLISKSKLRVAMTTVGTGEQAGGLCFQYSAHSTKKNL